MHDGHLPEIATVGALVLSGVTLLWNVLRKQREDDDKKFAMLVEKLDDAMQVVAQHVTADAAAHATFQARIEYQDKRSDKLEARIDKCEDAA